MNNDLKLPDNKTCGDCFHSLRCKKLFDGNDSNTSCQFSPNRYQPAKPNQEYFIPPDNGEECWPIDASTYTRREVAYLLYTQRAMISNDLKNECGNDLTPQMYEVLDSPRIPEF